MDNIPEIDEGEKTQSFPCPECKSEVKVIEILDESFEYECTQCNRTGTRFF